jgi:hypothetical protein
MAFGEEREQLVLRAFFDQSVLRDGLLELRIGDDDLARVGVGGVDAQFAEGRGDDSAGEQLAVADDQVGDARREFAQRRQSAQNLIERIELLVNLFDQGGGVCDQGRGCVAVARAQPRTDGQRSGAVTLHGSRCGQQQLVGDLGHGADDDYRLLAQRHAPGDDGRSAADGRWILHRCAAEFHYDQVHASFLKAVLSSQFFASNSVC